jgi:hypothetical protein
MKACSKCNVTKPLEEFYLSKKRVDGRMSACKTCEKERDRMRYVSNPDLKKAKREQAKIWRANNRERHRAYSCQYERDHREEQNKKSRERWGEKDREYHREYRKRDYVKQRIEAYEKDRRRDDPALVIKHRLRSRLLGAVKKNKTRKADKTIKLLGCSFVEFRTYFESKFIQDMTWDRFLAGDIHIDHIKPCSSFDLTDPAQQRECFHYTNLQPLWEIDNLRKSDRLDYLVSDASKTVALGLINPKGEAALKTDSLSTGA